MTALQVTGEEFVPCIDEDCPGKGEVELENDLVFLECGECGSTWNFTKAPKDGGEFCQLGIPDEVRRVSSAPMEQAIADSERPKTIPLTVKR
jgi:hypothetical protein